MIKKQFKSFLAALMFFTRIPVSFKTGDNTTSFEKATKFLPVIGWIVGGFCALIVWSCSLIFPVLVSVILSMIAGILLTGAFHEDGLSDVCDGFGGGRTKERILEIMKDSHTGAYGVIGLIMILGLKFVSLNEISIKLLPFAMIAAHSLSRFATVMMMNIYPYVRRSTESKVKSVITKMSFAEILFAGICGVLPLLLFQNYYFFLLIIPVIFAALLLGIYFNKRIGGYTGDCLGATQQITEVVFYLSLIVLWKYI